MRIEILLTFITVARTCDIRLAAAALAYSESSVRYHLRVLERSLGTVLLRRGGRDPDGYVLTTEGHLLLPLATAVVEAHEALTSSAAGCRRIPSRSAGRAGPVAPTACPRHGVRPVVEGGAR